MKRKGFTHESTANKSKEWYTPKRIFDCLGIEFDMDVCSPGKDIVPWIPAKKHLTISDDGLAAEWSGNVWCNPPYGGETLQWVRRLSRHGNGIALVFARTDTQWFHDYVTKANGILFIRKRVEFIPLNQAADYANGMPVKNTGSGAGSMLIAFGSHNLGALEKAANQGLGTIIKL